MLKDSESEPVNQGLAFGAWLRERRQALDLTREQLAAQTGCATDTLRMIETGRRRASRELAELLARSLKLPDSSVDAFVQFARGLADVPPEAPSLPTAPAPPRRAGTLPLLPTALVGREEEQEQLLALLRSARPRLLTLTGPSGIGKTSLAIAAAGAAAPHFADGVYFVPLAPLSDPQLVAPTIARALGVIPASDRPLVESLHDFLWTREILLVLDNFEQVMAAAPLVAEMLQLAPKLKALVTSRGVLRLRGEKEVALRLLDLAPTNQNTPDQLLEYAAIRLFVERASEARDGFALTRENGAAVAEITRKLDGLPLAIELAAARVRALTPQAMLERLASRLALLEDGPIDLPPRQRTMRNAIAWGHDLLAPDERMLFRRMAVFVGGATLEAIVQVCFAPQAPEPDAAKRGIPLPGNNGAGALSVLDPLLRMSMIRLADAEGSARFWMLETIREYALETLERSGEAAELRFAHASFFLELAETAARQLTGPNQQNWLNQLEAEHDNLRAALRWLLDHEHIDLALRLGAALWRFWWVHSHISEGRAWLLEILQAEQRKGRTASQPELAAAEQRGVIAARAGALAGAGLLSREQGEYEEARALMEQSLALQRALGDKTAIAGALTNLAIVTSDQGQFATARAFYDEAITLAQEAGDKLQLSRALLNLSTVAFAEGKYDEARVMLEQALALSREIGNIANIGTSLHNLGRVLFELGDYAGARAYHEGALVIRREQGNKTRIASGLSHLGHIVHAQGDKDAARDMMEQALAIRRSGGGRSDLASSLSDLGLVMLDEEDYKGALVYLRESLKLHRTTGAREAICYCLLWLAGVAGGMAQPERAARLLGAVEAMRATMGIPLRATQAARFARIVAEGQATLAKENWDSAWQEGRTLPLEQIIRFALDEPAPLEAPR